MQVTKQQALALSGYKPRRGRPKRATEPMAVVSTYVPERVAQAIPRPRAPWVRDAIEMRQWRERGRR